MVKKFILLIYLMWFSSSNASTFSEVFGSEGAAGIENPKTRSLSYTLQYSTLTGSIGYVLKKMHDSAFFEPLGITPDSIKNLSPLAYKKQFLTDKHSANIIFVNQKVDELNYLNNLRKDFLKERFSSEMIEIRNNSNLSSSLRRSLNANDLLNKYYEK